jgi:hypothetical protein
MRVACLPACLPAPPPARPSQLQVPAGADVAWFVNTPALQSVPTIWHAHILWRQPPAAAEQQQ